MYYRNLNYPAIYSYDAPRIVRTYLCAWLYFNTPDGDGLVWC